MDSGSAHALTTCEVAEQGTVDPDCGLSSAIAKQRLIEYGPNQLDESTSPRLWRVLLSQFHNPLIYVVIGAIKWVDNHRPASNARSVSDDQTLRTQ